MSEWQWFLDSYYEALHKGDAQRVRLLQLHDQAFSHRETDPDRTLALFAEGQRLAEQVGDPWWVMLFDQWQVHAVIYYKNDFRHVLDRVVRNVLELRKPIFTQYPQRLWIYNDLVTSYLNIDPIGYAVEIEQALRHLESELKPQPDDSAYLLLENKVEFHLVRQRWQEALDLTLEGLNLTGTDSDRHRSSHYLIAVHGFLCLLALARRQWAELAQWSLAAEESARRMNYQYPLALALLWQALAAQQQGDVPHGQRLFHSALRRKSGLRWPACRGWYEAQCHYHMLRSEMDKALAVRQRQFADIRDKGQLACECTVLIEQCRLHKIMGALAPEHLDAARQAARTLRQPESYLTKIDKIVAGEVEL